MPLQKEEQEAAAPINKPKASAAKLRLGKKQRLKNRGREVADQDAPALTARKPCLKVKDAAPPTKDIAVTVGTPERKTKCPSDA